MQEHQAQSAHLSKDGCIVSCWPGPKQGNEKAYKGIKSSPVILAVRVARGIFCVSCIRKARSSCALQQCEVLSLAPSSGRLMLVTAQADK